MCKTPITTQVNDDKTNRTLLIVMQDVCGQRVKILAKFGMWGYSLEEATRRPEITYDETAAAIVGAEADAKLEHLAVNATDARRIRSAAGGGRRGASAALAAGVVGVAAALWL